MFCPFINDECRSDCVFNAESCAILEINENIKKLQKQTVDCSYIYSIYSKINEIAEK